MQRRLFAILAVGLIASGVVLDRVVTITFGGPSTVAAANAVRSMTNSGAPAASIDRATENAYGIASASVVYVVSAGVGSGSGVIYDSQGDIVTNDHVVNGATKLTVTLNDGRTVPATVVGTDKADDLAIIHVKATSLHAARFAVAGTYHVAQMVLAVGSPLGLKQSVTSGLISGLHRVEQEPNGAYLSNAIQTSAPINPGNSGGALVALDGTVVGIPTLEQTSSSNGSAAQNIGFAVPSERVVLVANQIVASGKVEHTGRAYLGIAPTDNSPQSGSLFGPGGNGTAPSSPAPAGALVQQAAPNGPAGRAGVQQGDVITGVNGTSVGGADDLLTFLAGEAPGNQVTLQINRNGASLSIHVQLGELPA